MRGTTTKSVVALGRRASSTSARRTARATPGTWTTTAARRLAGRRPPSTCVRSWGDQNEGYVESDHVHIGDDDEGWMVHGAAAILYEREGNSKTDVHSGDDDVRWMAHWAAAILHGREGNSEIFQSERE
uniref:Uncharacterized protein n=1 Tax=Alexandrium monilatum TaxID=311494 RepID=A0A7S4RMT7_9DINO